MSINLRIFPRIRTPAFMEFHQQLPKMTEEQMPRAGIVIGDLLVTYAIEVGNTFRPISALTCKEVGINRKDLATISIMNLRSLVTKPTIQSKDQLFAVQTGHDMEAAMILIPEFWNQVQQTLGDTLAVAVLHRNKVVLTRSSSKENRVKLRELVDSENFSNTHALFRRIYTWSSGEWS